MNNLSGPGSTDRKKKVLFFKLAIWLAFTVSKVSRSVICLWRLFCRDVATICTSVHAPTYTVPCKPTTAYLHCCRSEWPTYSINFYPSSPITSLEIKERCWLVVWRSPQDNFHFIWSFHLPQTWPIGNGCISCWTWRADHAFPHQAFIQISP